MLSEASYEADGDYSPEPRAAATLAVVSAESTPSSKSAGEPPSVATPQISADFDDLTSAMAGLSMSSAPVTETKAAAVPSDTGHKYQRWADRTQWWHVLAPLFFCIRPNSDPLEFFRNEELQDTVFDAVDHSDKGYLNLWSFKRLTQLYKEVTVCEQRLVELWKQALALRIPHASSGITATVGKALKTEEETHSTVSMSDSVLAATGRAVMSAIDGVTGVVSDTFVRRPQIETADAISHSRSPVIKRSFKSPLEKRDATRTGHRGVVEEKTEADCCKPVTGLREATGVMDRALFKLLLNRIFPSVLDEVMKREQFLRREEDLEIVRTVYRAITNVWDGTGPGHREAAYQRALYYELKAEGFANAQREKRVPVYYRTAAGGRKLHLVSIERIDLWLPAPIPVVIELKAVSSKLSLKDECQVRKYSKYNRHTSVLANFPNSRFNCETRVWRLKQRKLLEVFPLQFFKFKQLKGDGTCVKRSSVKQTVGLRSKSAS